ncbi:beta-lactamase family protein [Actinosynnema pretiosum subsp. pretiosum]|uniref:Beta-lactamase family protein n=1 Tax=Actinosynnema pretiosum subsp. pretiosum TaxID=103721 RepID=A0AA45L7R0_9PSEU|nr:Beta-lactamase [Actinosynnema pretiosum subsp. pretiosum]QUF04360.1 beta-lactamase family protein [Actinosynnema pretiosum subsp. pretiosum]
MSPHDAPPRPSAPTRAARSRRVGALVAVAAAALLAGCGAAPGQGPAPHVTTPAAPETARLTPADVNAWLDGVIPAGLENGGVVGATVSVVHDGQVLTARGYGLADTGENGNTGEAPTPVDPEKHLFRPGSVSKLVTATAVMQQVQAGKIDLDADIKQYLDFDLPTEFDTPITTRHLLTHTPGFEERVANLLRLDGVPANLREALVTDPPAQVYAPGTTPAYSNYGNSLAGYLVERVTGTRFEEYVEREVFDRIGMTSSSFEQPLPERLKDRMSGGYNDSANPVAQPFEIVTTPPAGALTASATDMARFMLAHLGAQTGGTPLLDEATMKLMHEGALDAEQLGGLADGPRMTLGFFDESRNGHRIIGHGGDTNFFHSHLQLYPGAGAGKGTGLFVSFNSTGVNGGVQGVRNAVLNGFADRYFPKGASTGGTSTEGASAMEYDHDAAPLARDEAVELAARVQGEYDSSRRMDSTLLSAIDLTSRTTVTAREDGTLLFQPGPASASPAVYEAVGEHTWREVGGQRVLSTRIEDGRVTGIAYEDAFTLLPTPAQRSAGLVLPVLIGSLVVLVLAVVSWPIAAVARRSAGVAPRDRAGRLARVLAKVGTLSGVLAAAGWAASVTALMQLQEIPAAQLRSLQLLQLLAALAVVPAGVRLYDDARRRTGWTRVVGSALVLLALIGLAWFAVEFNFLAPDISY